MEGGPLNGERNERRQRLADPFLRWDGVQRTLRPGKGVNKATAEQICWHRDHWGGMLHPKVWPKLFQNLRASCETDWLDSGMPAHVVANWIGHSVKVQNDNYAQVDDHHFEQFSKATSESVASQVALQTPETMETEQNAKRKDPEKTLCFPGSSSHFVTVRKSPSAPERSRTNAVSPEVQQHSENRGALCGAVPSDSDRYAHFADLLKSRGFTSKQLAEISKAMTDAGLELTEAREATRFEGRTLARFRKAPNIG